MLRIWLAALLLLTSGLVLAHGMSAEDQARALSAGYLEYIELGAVHMITGYDHLLFLFGVVFASGDSQPITVALNNLVNTSTGVKEYNVDMAAAMIAALPTLVVYIVAGKYFIRGLTAGSVKG